MQICSEVRGGTAMAAAAPAGEPNDTTGNVTAKAKASGTTRERNVLAPRSHTVMAPDDSWSTV